jgi:carbon-monoxide dehydrogenase large subunit
MTSTASAASHNHPRVEDNALVRGAGRFVDDPHLPNQAYAVFVRSPHAHARVLSVKTDEALKVKKVLAVLTAEDMKAAGVGSVSRHPPVVGRGGAKMAMPFRPALAGDKVMHVGDAVAMVVAETPAAAQDAADLVIVEYDELTPVVDLETAMKAETVLFDEAPGNLIVDWPGTMPSEENEREVAKILAEAAHVARVRVTNQRMIVASMETRGGTGVYDKATDGYTLHACSQSADALRGQGAAVMGVPNEKLRVITEDVGGAFGMKTPFYPEYAALLVGARKIGRPVHWMSTRSEAFLTDTHARDTITEAELALDEKGKFLALRMRRHQHQQLRALRARHVPHPQGGLVGRLLFRQQDADRSLSRRGAPRSELRARARGGGSRAHHRHRQGAAAQEEPDPCLGHAAQDRRRQCL